MSGIIIHQTLCDLCGVCENLCPFHAIEIGKQVQIGTSCKLSLHSLHFLQTMQALRQGLPEKCHCL